MRKARRNLTLNKGVEQYIFRWEKGQEAGFLRALREHVADERTSFDAFDAAVLGSRLRRILTSAGRRSPDRRFETP